MGILETKTMGVSKLISTKTYKFMKKTEKLKTVKLISTKTIVKPANSNTKT
jgi:hypothetical protein